MRRFAADTWLLLALQSRLAWNAFTSRSLLRRLVAGASLVLIGLFAGSLASGIGYGAGRLLRRFPGLGLEPLLPGLLLTVPVLLLLVISFGVALGTLFLAGDLELLMAAPVDRRAVIASRLLGSMGWYYALLGATALPALVAYGLALGYGPLYYIAAVASLLAVPLFPAGVAALLAMIVARFAPPRRVSEAMGLAAGLFGIAFSIAGQTARLWTRTLFGSATSVRALLASLRDVDALPIPTFVAGRGLAAAGAGHLSAAVGDLAGFALLTFGAFALCLAGADTLYASGWVRMQSGGAASRRRTAGAEAGGWLARAPVFMAICWKDWQLLLRDLRNFAQLLTPLLLMPFVYANLLGRSSRRNGDLLGPGGPLGSLAADARAAAVAAGVLILSVLIFGRLARTSVSREGAAWWVLKAAPISSSTVLVGKLAAAAIPFVAVSTLLMGLAALWNGYSLAGAIYGWYGVEVLGLAMLALNVACSVPWAKLDWDDPRRAVSGWATAASLAGSAVFGLVAGILLCLPLLAQQFAASVLVTAWIAGPLTALALSAAVTRLAIQFGARRLPLVGEQ